MEPGKTTPLIQIYALTQRAGRIEENFPILDAAEDGEGSNFEDETNSKGSEDELEGCDWGQAADG